MSRFSIRYTGRPSPLFFALSYSFCLHPLTLSLAIRVKHRRLSPKDLLFKTYICDTNYMISRSPTPFTHSGVKLYFFSFHPYLLCHPCVIHLSNVLYPSSSSPFFFEIVPCYWFLSRNGCPPSSQLEGEPCVVPFFLDDSTLGYLPKPHCDDADPEQVFFFSKVQSFFSLGMLVLHSLRWQVLVLTVRPYNGRAVCFPPPNLFRLFMSSIQFVSSLIFCPLVRAGDLYPIRIDAAFSLLTNFWGVPCLACSFVMF